MAGKPIATQGSMHICPMCSGYIPHVGGPVSGPGAPNVLINGKPAALMGDMCACAGPPDSIIQGEPTVLINGSPVATQGCMTAHGGSITVGDPTVLISSATPSRKAYVPIKRIPFPKINLFDQAGALLRGQSGNLSEARANIEKIKRKAETEQDTLELTNMVWKKSNEKITSTTVGSEVLLCADIAGAQDNDTISLKIFDKDREGGNDYLGIVQGTVENSKIAIPWKVKYMKDTDDRDSQEEEAAQGYTTPEYIFTGSTPNTLEMESSALEVKGWFRVQLKREKDGEPYIKTNYILYRPDGTEEEGTTDENGYLDCPDVGLGNFEIALKKEQPSNNRNNE